MNIYIYRTPILMGMGVMSSGMQGGKTWGDRGGGGGRKKRGQQGHHRRCKDGVLLLRKKRQNGENEKGGL